MAVAALAVAAAPSALGIPRLRQPQLRDEACTDFFKPPWGTEGDAPGLGVMLLEPNTIPIPYPS